MSSYVCTSCVHLFFVVVKAQRISDDSVLAGEDFVFPTENDDLGNFTGGSAEIMFSNNILRDVLDQLPPSKASHSKSLYDFLHTARKVDVTT